MTIATEKTKFSSERFFLVRINPARFIQPTLNGSVYEITLPFIVNRVERNGVALVKDLTTPTVNDHWFQDETTRLLQVKLALAPNDTTNVLIAFHYLFYTGTIFRAISEDPEDSATTVRNWEPRILNYPVITESFENILAGVFTINDLTIDLINEDRNIQPFLGENDSFYKKQVDIWACINSVENIKKIFTGSIVSISFTQNTTSIKVADSFNKLKDIAFMGDDNDEVYATSDGFPNVFNRDLNKTIPYIVGPYSRWRDTLFSVIGGSIRTFELRDGNQALATNYSATFSTSTNRNWTACRQKAVVQTQTFGAITAVADVGDGHIYIKFASYSNVYIGDTLKYNTGGTDYWGRVNQYGSLTYLSNPYNIQIFSTAGSFTLASTVTAVKSFAITITDSTNAAVYYPKYQRDYTIDDSTVTSGGNRLVEIDFVNNFEANLSMSTLDPNKHTIFYRTTNNSPESHGQILIDMLGKVGLAYDATSFTQADTDLDAEVLFSIPNFDEQDYSTYLKYTQDVLKSTLGFLRINQDFEVEYKLIQAPTSTSVRDESLTLDKETSCEVQYQDIATQIIAFNPHNSSDWETTSTPSSNETRTSNKASYLHDILNTDRFRHVLRFITDRIDDIFALRSRRSAIYRFATATQDIDSALGDDIQLENSIVLGDLETQDVKILSIEKTPKQTKISASDFMGV